VGYGEQNLPPPHSLAWRAPNRPRTRR
jgi:hypothetical protein